MTDNQPARAGCVHLTIAGNVSSPSRIDFAFDLSDFMECLKQRLTSDELRDFWAGWDTVGGGPCSSLRQKAAHALQAPQLFWQDVVAPAEALQELCWEKLHTGHWMDVAVAWRDAYTLYTLLAVMAKLAAACLTSSAAGARQEQQQLQQQQPTQHLGMCHCQLVTDSPLCDTQHSTQQQHLQQQAAAVPFEAAAAAVPPAAADVLLQLQLLPAALKQLDLAAMMGGLRFRPLLDKAVDTIDRQLLSLRTTVAAAAAAPAAAAAAAAAANEQGEAASAAAGVAVGAAAGAASEGRQGLPDKADAKRRRIDAAAGSLAVQPRDATSCCGIVQCPDREAAGTARAVELGVGCAGGDGDGGPSMQGQQQQQQPLLPPGSLSAASAVVLLEQCPSLEQFMTKYMLATGGPSPCVIRGAMQHWPALSKWTDLAYISRVAGRRTVPVELGQHYLQEGWGTQLMTLDNFITQHMMSGQQPTAAAAADQQQESAATPIPPAAAAVAVAAPASRPLGYLAQHQLFEQVPALAADIVTPDYCMLGEVGISSVNAWFGPAGTVTPLHQDPEHNLLAQVVGRKYVRLYDPQYTPQLHPHEAGMHTNTSQVDVEAPDDARFPGFRRVPFTDVLLQPGDMLYIPPKHWHYVKSLSASFSVSFWWS